MYSLFVVDPDLVEIMQKNKQIDLANWLKLSPGYLSLLFRENRKLSWKMAEKIAQVIDARDVSAEKIIAASGPELRELLFRKYRTANRRRKEREKKYAQAS